MNKFTLVFTGISVTAADTQCKLKINISFFRLNDSKTIDAMENSTALIEKVFVSDDFFPSYVCRFNLFAHIIANF